MAYENMSAAVRRDLQKMKMKVAIPCSPQTCPFPDNLCRGCRNADSCKEEE